MNEFENEGNTAIADPSTFEGTPLYIDIESYKAATGKRYRMTKEQKERGISREDAFEEFRFLPENCTNS